MFHLTGREEKQFFQSGFFLGFDRVGANSCGCVCDAVASLPLPVHFAIGFQVLINRTVTHSPFQVGFNYGVGWFRVSVYGQTPHATGCDPPCPVPSCSSGFRHSVGRGCSASL